MQIHVRHRLHSADVVSNCQAGIDWVQCQCFAPTEAVPSHSTACIAASAAAAAAAGYLFFTTSSVSVLCIISFYMMVLLVAQAHPPIHPTKHTAGESSWPPERTRLYEFIVRSFLATCSKPAVGFETRLEICVAGEGFSTTGQLLTHFLFSLHTPTMTF